MKRLIVNADDFGYTRGVNRAIVEAHQRGIVTSTSLMANGPAFEDAVEQSRSEAGLDIGCHLNFVEGQPLCPPDQVPRLVGADGRFLAASQLALRLVCGRVPQEELEREATAQIEKLIQAGIRPSHVDTHKHTHVHPQVATAVARAALRFGVSWIRRPFENWRPRAVPGSPGRKLALRALCGLSSGFERRMVSLGLRLPDFFTGILLTGRLTRQTLAETLTGLPPGITELMCHPGYVDEELRLSPTRLKPQREVERQAVADPSWRDKLRDAGIVLTSFEGLTKPRPLAESPWEAVSVSG